jgi:hypothetical protein
MKPSSKHNLQVTLVTPRRMRRIPQYLSLSAHCEVWDSNEVCVVSLHPASKSTRLNDLLATPNSQIVVDAAVKEFEHTFNQLDFFVPCIAY